jgi:integrase/recombinase XerD
LGVLLYAQQINNKPMKARDKQLLELKLSHLPAIILNAGDDAVKKFLEFFTVSIRNKNTRLAYARAIGQFFMWCEGRNLSLFSIQPVSVAAYIEQHQGSAPTVKQHLSAIRQLFDYLLIGQVVPANPASPVKGPKHVVRKGKTPVLSAEEARTLLESIDTASLIGLRDLALISVMLFSFARISAVLSMRVSDFFRAKKRYWIRLHEKGGKFHEVPLHDEAKQNLLQYIAAARIGEQKKARLFRTFSGQSKKLSDRSLTRTEAFRMVKRRCKAAGLPANICNHSFRATGITVYLQNQGELEHAQFLAAHESPSTTKLYDRRKENIAMSEIEKIKF